LVLDENVLKAVKTIHTNMNGIIRHNTDGLKSKVIKLNLYKKYKSAAAPPCAM